MRLIFLDIDGVLNSAEFFAKQSVYCPDVGPLWAHDSVAAAHAQDADELLDRDAVSLLNELIRATGAVVVVSSSWRMIHPLDYIIRALTAHGFTGSVAGETPQLGPPRGNEIQSYLDTLGGMPSFVILDDRDDMTHLSHRLVQTTWGTGLQLEHVDRAAQMLEPAPLADRQGGR